MKKPSLKMLYLAMEQASHVYAETGSSSAQQEVLDLITMMHQCLDDIESVVLSEDEEPHTGELEAIR